MFSESRSVLTAETLLRMTNEVAERRMSPAQAGALQPLARRLLEEISKVVDRHGHGFTMETEHAPEGWSVADY
jgi:hypothetical protein